MSKPFNLKIRFNSTAHGFNVFRGNNDVEVKADDRLSIGIHGKPVDDAII